MYSIESRNVEIMRSERLIMRSDRLIMNGDDLHADRFEPWTCSELEHTQ
jgi:hypothetical protein